VLQAALNGARTRADHPAVPLSAGELARDAAACRADAFHIHPRDADGREALDAVDAAVAAVRAACGRPVGVSSGAWIEPDLERRIALVRAWREPDYASVNLSEEGADRVMRALTEAGIGIEAGIWSVEDAERLAETGIAVTRILVEPVDAPADRAVAIVDEIHAALDRLGLTAPRLQHGDGAATWILIEDAVRRRIDTRVGLEDTLNGPEGHRTTGNEELVREARALGA